MEGVRGGNGEGRREEGGKVERGREWSAGEVPEALLSQKPYPRGAQGGALTDCACTCQHTFAAAGLHVRSAHLSCLPRGGGGTFPTHAH